MDQKRKEINDTWRPATAEEIKEYYIKEFPSYIDQLPHWITPTDPHQFAVSFRSRYPTTYNENTHKKDFIRRDTKNDDGSPEYTFNDWDEVIEFIREPATNDPLRKSTNGGSGLAHPATRDEISNDPVPEAVYYSLDNRKYFWILAFDIDAKDVAKKELADSGQAIEDVSDQQLEDADVYTSKPKPQTISGKKATISGRDKPLVAAYPYRFRDLEQTIQYGIKLREFLSSTVDMSDVRMYYSGQGVHVYAYDSSPRYHFTMQSRRFITKYIKERLNIPIDDSVTWDRKRVIRLPYTLHADVSRRVVEIQSEEFDPKIDATPAFIKNGK